MAKQRADTRGARGGGRRLAGTGALAALAAFGAACAAPRPPPAMLDVAVEQHAGTILTGPLDTPLSAEALGDPWFVALRFAYVEEPPPGPSVPLSTAARGVFVDGASPLLAGRGELALDVRVTERGAPARTTRWELRTLDAVWPGTALVRRARPTLAVKDPPAAPWRSFEVELARRPGEPGSAELALAFEGLVAPRLPEDDAEAPPVPAPIALGALGALGAPRREHVVLAAEPQAGEDWRFFLPAPAPRAPRGGYALEVSLRTALGGAADGEAREDALARGRDALERARVSTRDRGSALGAGEGFRFESERALAALARPDLQRKALVFLAQSTGAELAGELALVAEPDALSEALTFVRESLEQEGAPEDAPAALGWFLERTSYRWLAARAADPRRPLEPELLALLLRRAGQLGRYPDLILESVQASAGLEDLAAQLRAENAIFLEDSDPAARVRACDWLRERGLAPEGYDPLGTRDERRAALARVEEAAAGAADAAPAQGAQR